MQAVKSPTGSSYGAEIVRAAISANTRITAPYKKDNGMSFQKSIPISFRIICGINKPMNPIFPATATHTPQIGIKHKIV